MTYIAYVTLTKINSGCTFDMLLTDNAYTYMYMHHLSNNMGIYVLYQLVTSHFHYDWTTNPLGVQVY